MPGVPAPDWEPDGNGRDVPAKITVEDFRRHYLASFPKLAAEKYDGLVQDAIDAAYAAFSGVSTLWDRQPKRVWHDKTVLCYRLLTAWYIADKYGDLVPGTLSIGGLPLARRKVDGVDLTFDTSLTRSEADGAYRDTLSCLKSNSWGRMALMMIQTSAKRAMLRNRRIT